MAEKMTSLTGPERLPADGTKADSVVVLLHGLGADGADLIGLAPDFARLLPRTAWWRVWWRRPHR